MAVAFLFDEVLFDPSLLLREGGGDSPLSGWPELANTVIKNEKTGVHKTNVNRFDAVEHLTLDLALINNTKLPYLVNFWRGGYGSGVGFRCRVLWDYVATLESFATSDGVRTQFQLAMTYTRPGVTARQDVRAIVKPVVPVAQETNGFQLYEADGTTVRVITNTFRLYRNGVEIPSGWTVNAKTGVVTFAVAPAAGTLAWSGEFDIPAAFVGNAITQNYNVSSTAQARIREILPAELGLNPVLG